MTILDHINSVTKYPSILTYHKLEGGTLTDEVQVSFEGERAIVTEKIDGTNTRIIYFAKGVEFTDDFSIPMGSYIIGSRQDLLYAKGDMIHNQALGIVDAVRQSAEKLSDLHIYDYVYVFYGEVYGGNVTKASKFYTSKRTVGFRIFDVLQFTPKDFRDLVEMPREQISSWRENGGQPFAHEVRIRELAAIWKQEVTPRLCSASIPIDVPDTLKWLQYQMPRMGSKAILDTQGKGMPEGVVIRTPDRQRIAKIRYEDYNKYMRKLEEARAKQS